MLDLRPTLGLLPFLAAGMLPAQDASMELVRNGGFESVDKKVTTYDQLRNATGWTNGTLGLSEVFSEDASAKTVGIPVNDYGIMKPFEGQAYAGFFGWKDDVRRSYDSSDPEEVFVPGWNSYSEYIQGELVQPLVEGQTYELSFQVALSGNSDRSILGIGAFFGRTARNYQHRKFMEEVPQLYIDKPLKEKSVWTEFKETFVADGGETVIVIGVFPYVGLESERLIEGTDNQYAYYYLDAVSLKRVEATPSED
ncbi:MAG: hypothetical protein R2815_02650 [Flavobacteriales bacterium]